jgi:hypothetical protein
MSPDGCSTKQDASGTFPSEDRASCVVIGAHVGTHGIGGAIFGVGRSAKGKGVRRTDSVGSGSKRGGGMSDGPRGDAGGV